MKRNLFVLIACCCFCIGLNGQCLNDYYRKAGGLNFFYSGTFSNSEVYSNYSDYYWRGYRPLTGLNFDVTHYNQKTFSYSYDCKFQIIGDALPFYFSRYRHREEPFISSFFEGSFGINLSADSDFVVFAGLKPRLEIIKLLDCHDENNERLDYINNGGNIFIGPTIRIDKIIYKWLGFRLRSSVEYGLVALGSQDEQTHPIMITANPEIITKSGIYFGVEYKTLPTLVTYSKNMYPFYVKRIDFILGWRFEEIFN